MNRKTRRLLVFAAPALGILAFWAVLAFAVLSAAVKLSELRSEPACAGFCFHPDAVLDPSQVEDHRVGYLSGEIRPGYTPGADIERGA